MQLEEVHGTSTKTNKPWTGYQVTIGLYKTPLFFPTEIEQMYIKKFIQKQAHEDFKGDDLNVGTSD